MATTDLAAVPGVAECALDAATLDRLPPTAPPAPWDCTLDGVVWWCRGGRGAARAAGSVRHGHTLAPAVIGGFITYTHTPVGRYDEVFGAIAVPGRRLRGTIPFMAVDSTASLVAGRANWSLPKCLADFTGRPGAGTMTARGAGWSVRARVRPFGPRIPLPMAGRIVQPGPGGGARESVVTGRACARAALVTVEVQSGGELASWLRPGRHLGAVLSEACLRLSEAR
jgi:hypothetical protein